MKANIFRSVLKWIALVSIFGILSVVVCAAPGDLDATFNGTGKFRGNFGGGDDKATAAATQSDGKLVVAGYSKNAAGLYEFAIARYNTDGSPDSTFDRDGRMFAGIGSCNVYANAMAIQTDGKIVLAGYSQCGSGNKDFAVMRFNSDSSLDTTFDSDGKKNDDVNEGGSAASAKGAAIQSDGKIVVAGTAGGKFAAARYNPDGSPDASFDFDGKLTTTVGSGNSGGGNAMAIQTNGKIVVAGYAYNGSNNDFAVVRYNATDGSLDSTFGTSGKVITTVGSLNDVGNAVAIQTDGKILVAGSTETSANVNDFAVVRYNADGSLDSSSFTAPQFAAAKSDSFPSPNNPLYGTGGKAIFDVSGGNDVAYGIALDSSGRAIVVGDANGLFGVIRILGNAVPTAASVTVSGRVLTPAGKGLMNATVLLTDAQGNTRSTRTSTFGYYQFNDVAVGETYIFEVRSKRFQFAPQVVSIMEEMNDLNFTAGQ